MQKQDYYSHPYCSNSALTMLAQELGLYGSKQSDKDPYDNFRLGTLFDALVTEPHLIDLNRQIIIGTGYEFSEKEYLTMQKMHESLRNDITFSEFISLRPSSQKEIYCENFSFDGSVELNMKAKLDWQLPGLVVDLKTTSAKTEESFNYAFEMFGYHRQMRLYCELTESRTAFTFAVSKIFPHPVFIIKFCKKHALWEQAGDELKELMLKYKLIVE